MFDELREAGLAMDTLSMGMTADLEAAIAAGSTMVRVGTAIFGGRPRLKCTVNPGLRVKPAMTAVGLAAGYFFAGGAIGLMLPQSEPSHLPPPSMFIFSGLPRDSEVTTIFML